VSCWAVGFCEAVGDGSNASDAGRLQEVGAELASSNWQSTVFVAPPGSPSAWIGSLNAISCDTAGTCLAAGGLEVQFVQPVTATVSHGVWDSSETQVSALPSNTQTSQDGIFSSVSCADANDCTAVGYYVDNKGDFQAMQSTTSVDFPGNDAAAIEAPAAGATPTTSEIAYANAVACPTATDCLVAGDYNVVENSQYVLEPIITIAGSAPSTPTGVEALAGNGSLKVEWTASVANWDASHSYTARAGAASCTTTGTSCTIRGLKNKTSYKVTVTPKNSYGVGLASAAVIGIPTSGKPKGPPGTVRSLTAKGCAGCVTLAWKAPTTAGTGVAYYLACATTGAQSCQHVTKVTAKFNAKVAEKFTVTVYAKDGEHSKAVTVTGTPK
jgi:hypothetical protein